MGSDWRGPQITGRLPLRIAILGGVGVVVFAVLFFRLWYLQVLSGDQYLAEAKNNRVREFRVHAPRGNILDRDGNVLVDNRTSLALQLNTPRSSREPGRASPAVSTSATSRGCAPLQIRKTIREEQKSAPAAPVTLRRDVGYDLVYYLQENQGRFPGVAVERVFVRHYPHGTLAAHVLGNVGEVNEEELKEPPYKGLEPGDEVGQDGVEYTYDSLLRGQTALTRPGRRARPADPADCSRRATRSPATTSS